MTTSPIESFTSPRLPTLVFCFMDGCMAHGARARGHFPHAPCARSVRKTKWRTQSNTGANLYTSVPESPPMEHYGTLVVAGLSDHTVKLTPLDSFNRTEVVKQNAHERCATRRRQPKTCQAELHRARRASNDTGPSAAVMPDVRTGRVAHSPPAPLICHLLSPPLRHPTAGTCLP